MKKILLMIAATMSIAFTACTKDKTDKPAPGNGNEEPAPAPTTKRLKRFTHTENGKSTVFELTYNADKKLASITSATSDNKTIFTYHPDGNLAKVEEVEDEFKNTYWYSYGAGGVPVSAVFKSWKRNGSQSDELIENDDLFYTVKDGKVIKQRLVMKFEDVMEVDFDFSYTDGKLTKVESTGLYPYSATFTYGTNKPVFPIVSKYVLDQAGFSLQYSALNEVKSLKFDFPGTIVDKTINVQYTYDNSGYALTSTDGKASVKYEYENI